MTQNNKSYIGNISNVTKFWLILIILVFISLITLCVIFIYLTLVEGKYKWEQYHLYLYIYIIIGFIFVSAIWNFDFIYDQHVKYNSSNDKYTD